MRRRRYTAGDFDEKERRKPRARKFSAIRTVVIPLVKRFGARTVDAAPRAQWELSVLRAAGRASRDGFVSCDFSGHFFSGVGVSKSLQFVFQRPSNGSFLLWRDLAIAIPTVFERLYSEKKPTARVEAMGKFSSVASKRSSLGGR